MTALAISIAVVVGTLPHPAFAQDTNVQFSISAQPLSKALLQFGEQTSLQIFFSQDTVEGYIAPGLAGTLQPEEGLRRLLAGTGIEFRRTGKNISLSRPASGEATVLAAVRVEARRAADGTTEGTGSYTSRVTSVASKSDQAFRDVPQSISVITRELLDDQKVQKIEDALKLAPGITVSRSNDVISNYYSRGFQITSMQIDGGAPLALGEYAYGPQQDLAFYDRVEIMRGASGLLGGMGDPGGIINLVRKKPLAEAALTFEQSVGRWNNYRTMVDATGPLAFDARLRGRAVVTYTDRDYFLQDRSTRMPAVYGVLEADLSENTLLTLGGSYQNRRERGSGSGVPRYRDGGDLELSRETSLTQPWALSRNHVSEVFSALEQGFANDWKLKLNLTHVQEAGNSTTAFVDGGINRATGKGALWGGGRYKTENKQTLADLSLSGDFKLWNQSHDFLLGADWQRVTSSWETGKPVDNWSVPADVFNPNPWNPDMDIAPNIRYSPWGQEQKGLYGMLRLRPTAKLQVIMGARVSRYAYNQDAADLSPTGASTLFSSSSFNETAVTPYGGLIYDLGDEWSAYASYAIIHKPQALLMSGPPPGNPLDPIEGKSYEMGLKGELLDGRLNSTVSLFNVERTGTGVLDPRYSAQSDPWAGSCCYVAQGKVISRGIDLEVGGEILPGWQAHVGYTFNSTKDKSSDKPYSSITPKHLFKLATVYTLPGSQGRWKVGGSALIQSRTYVAGKAYDLAGNSSAYDFVQGGYATVNLMTSYQVTPQWVLGVNVNNVFDRTYYEKVGSVSGSNWYGEPRSWTLSLRGQF